MLEVPHFKCRIQSLQLSSTRLPMKSSSMRLILVRLLLTLSNYMTSSYSNFFKPFSSLLNFSLFGPESIVLTELFMIQQFQILLDLVDTTLSLRFLVSSHESLVTYSSASVQKEDRRCSLESQLFIRYRGCFNLVTFLEPICNR